MKTATVILSMMLLSTSVKAEPAKNNHMCVFCPGSKMTICVCKPGKPLFGPRKAK